tara:strand:+ start:502 stop:798 length:297 start_codon:yes stop_codon:yes gene_type:complete
MFFPAHYKKALREKTKNTTIRTKEEIGKYKEGKIYKAKSYAGSDWEITIKVVKVTKIKLGELRKMNIPQKSITSIINKEKIDLHSKVELIQFKILSRN